MRRRCCVPNCNSAEQCAICRAGLSYFKGPRESSLIKRWESALGIKEQSLQSRDRVCSAHFRKRDVITKRFVSLKRPSTNSKMILEIAKLKKNTIPAPFRRDITECNHGTQRKTSPSTKLRRSEVSPEESTSAPASSQSEDSDDSSTDDRVPDEKQKLTKPTRRDYCAVEKSVENRSKRKQIRAYNDLRIKWLAKIKALEKQKDLLEDKIRELRTEEIHLSDC